MHHNQHSNRNYSQFNINKVINTLIVTGTIAISATFSYLNYLEAEQNLNKLIAADVQLAVQRGIDPTIIRCVYRKQSDNVCIVLAATRNSNNTVELITENQPK